MTLSGTLRDLPIVELVQFPAAGRKTGELIIVSEEDHARLYYQQGGLVHALTNAGQGFEALVSLLGWHEGEFEFRQDVAPEVTTIEGDLHLVVMQALKTLDERRMEEERRRAEQTQRVDAAQGGAGMDDALNRFLSQQLEQLGFASFAGVLDPAGEPVADTLGRIPSLPAWRALQSSLAGLLETYPRQDLSRLIAVDADGAVLLQRLPDRCTLIVVAPPETSLGAASMGVSRLAAALADGKDR